MDDSPTFKQIQKSFTKLLQLGNSEGYTAFVWGLIMQNCSKMIAQQHGYKTIDEGLTDMGVETSEELSKGYDA